MCLCGESLRANPPVASYVFPAGGRRGTTVDVRVGGLFLHQSCAFELLGPGVEATRQLRRTRTLFLEGPLLPLPESQQPEDYPKDMAGQVRIAAGAPPGVRPGRVWTSEGAASGLRFVVGDLPEVVEEEVDGDPVPVPVTLPVTINGRIFPREDVDVWSFAARKGQAVTCEVHAARLGSPLDARLEVLGPDGRPLAENDDARGADPLLRFTPPADGTYQVRIRDANLKGGPAYVYRLTLTAGPYVDRTYPLGGRRGTTTHFALEGQAVPAAADVPISADAPAAYVHLHATAGTPSNPVLLDVDNLPEHLEAERNDTPAQARVVPLPAVANGRIDRPGGADCWGFAARKGEAFVFELRAARLGSPLLGVLAVLDGQGKELAKAEAAGTQPDPVLAFTAPADGSYAVRVADRFRSRGGPAFAYRLRMAAPAPGFRLRLVADALSLSRKGQVKLHVDAERRGGFNDPIALTVDGLPSGVKAANMTIAAGQGGADVTLTADATAPVGAVHLTIRGTAKVGTQQVTETATLPTERGSPAVDTVLLGVAMPTPFKIAGAYDMRLIPRGSLHRRRYRVERNGYDGPIEVSLADKQARHLQGVSGPPVVVPAGANEFEFAVQLPPWMETGRTCRVCVMGEAVIKDGGAEHVVSYTSVEQNDQIIAVVETGRLGVEVDRPSMSVARGQAVVAPFRVSRGKGLAGPVKVEVVWPAHFRGVAAEPVTVPADQSRGALTLRFAPDAGGPYNMPVVVRATLADAAGPVVAETKLELVPQP
jgi:hypothetical protein